MKNINHKLLSALNLQIVFENDGKLYIEDMSVRPRTAVRGMLLKICNDAAEVNRTIEAIAQQRGIKAR